MIPGTSYNSVDVGYPYKLRGTNQQTDTGILYRTPSHKTYSIGGVTAVDTAYTPGMALGYFSLHNRSAATVVAGIGVRVPNYLWTFGQWTDATTTYTNDTTDAQDAGDDDVALETTTNSDGFVILSRVPFNAVSFDVTTASLGGTAVRAVRFANAAGTGWQTAESNLLIHNVSSGDYATGENLIVFFPPVDWGKSSGLATGIGNGYYAMNVRATTAPSTTAGLARAVEIFRLYLGTEGVADNATLQEEFSGREFRMIDTLDQGLVGDALVALFGTANDQNRVSAQVRAL